MSTVQEIRSAIENLSEHDKALLTAELFAMAKPDSEQLEAALEQGLQDAENGRVHEVEAVKNMIPQWTSKS